MQSRLAATAVKFSPRDLFSGHQKKFLAQRLCSATSSGRTADPAEHAVEPDVSAPCDFDFYACVVSYSDFDL